MQALRLIDSQSLLTFISGALDCVLQSFLFLLMDDNMNSTKTAMGVAILVACTSEIFMFPLAGTIIKKFGSPLVCIELGILSHCIRLLVSTFGRYTLPAEIVRGTRGDEVGGSIFYQKKHAANSTI